MKDAVLDVVAVISNQCRYKTRYELYRKFEAEMLAQPNVRLTTVECAFGERPHVVTDSENRRHVKVRTSHELWIKENLIEIGISHLQLDWKYVAWIDADCGFTRSDFALETIQQLQHHQIVQMFSHAIDLGPNQETLQTHMGFGYGHVMRKPPNHGTPNSPYAFFHPGYAWAATRNFIETVGGLMSWTLLGAADHVLACAVLGKLPLPKQLAVDCPNYIKLATEWMHRAAAIKQDMGFVPTTLLHGWHGRKADRKYVERWQILLENKYDPLADIKRDWQGVLALTENKPKLRDDLRLYFRQRLEDGLEA
jgi:hypothetical protein